MSIPNTEKYLLKIIKYGAIIPILLFSIIITFFLINQKNFELKKEIKSLKSNYINKNKEIVKNEVLRVTSSIEYEKKTSENKLKLFLKEKVYESHNVATSLYKMELNKIHNHIYSKEEVFETIKNALSAMIYDNGNGYIFIDNINGVKLLQPLNKELEGKNLLEFKDAKGYKFVKKIVSTIKKKTENYDKYYWYKSKKDKTAYEKMSFYKYFEPYNVAIGTGVYLKDFEEKLKYKLLQKINNIRFDKNRYIFILDSNGTYLSHIEKEKLNTNGFNLINKNKKYYIKDMVDFAEKNKEGFFSYNEEPNDREKILFVKYSQDWNWVVSAGFYLDELDIQIKQKEKELIKIYDSNILNIFLLSILITLILLIISFYFSKEISKRFIKYQKDVQLESMKTIEKEKLLVQQSKMATMGEMIGNIAHQWKQPLSIISMSNTLIKLNQENKNFSTQVEIDKAIDNVDNSVKHLSVTIDDFRDFFKPEKEKSYFNLKRLFDKAFKLISSQFINNNIKIIKDIEEIELYGYPNELLQVLINILKNAKDELISIEDNNEKLLFINVYKEESNVIIKIKDNANGINPANISKIFDAYFTTKDEEEGTGIGLYMSKQIIEGMKGSIEASNVSYEYNNKKFIGAEFTIII